MTDHPRPTDCPLEGAQSQGAEIPLYPLRADRLMRSILEEVLSVLRKAHLEHVADISVNALSLFFTQHLTDFSGIFLSEFSEIACLFEHAAYYL